MPPLGTFMETNQEKLGKAIMQLRAANPGLSTAQAADTVFMVQTLGVSNGNGHVANGKS